MRVDGAQVGGVAATIWRRLDEAKRFAEDLSVFVLGLEA